MENAFSRIQSLNGKWKYKIGASEETEITVPFSAKPVGKSVCTKIFNREADTGALLVLKGINYHAKVMLNGNFLGEMLAYAEYSFEVGDILREKDNVLVVELEDIDTCFGPSEGWENFGGITRDVYVKYWQKTRIESVFFHYSLKDARTSADIQIDTEFAGKTPDKVDFALLRDGKIIFGRQYRGNEKICFTQDHIDLWSPDAPNLYSYTLSVVTDGMLCDEKSEEIGFKSLTWDEHRFYLNGEPLFLKGVCRHEIVGDYGHNAPLAIVKNDFRLIKNLGCNFVRLVHYPQNEEILKIADRIGILVSEEPGLWNALVDREEVGNAAIEVMRRTVKRDRNHVSVAFWLAFNECVFKDSKYISRAVSMCRENDPSRPVSGANFMPDEDTKRLFDESNCDFYSTHPYSPDFQRAQCAADYLVGKPLVFTEWGGFFVYDNPGLMRNFESNMTRLYEEGKLAGSSFWYFSEIYDFNRGRPACVDGLLCEALYHLDRTPTAIAEVFRDGWVAPEKPKQDLRFIEKPIGKALQINNATGIPWDEAIKQKATAPAQFERSRARTLTYGPRFTDPPENMSAFPYVMPFGKKITADVNKNIGRIILNGIGALCGGYPLDSGIGKEIAVVRCVMQSGEEKLFSLRNGYEILTVYLTLGSSRIQPTAPNAHPLFELCYDRNLENYRLYQVILPFDKTENIASVSIEVTDEKSILLIYNIAGDGNDEI